MIYSDGDDGGHSGERWQSENLVIYPPPLRRFICEMFRSLVANLRIYELYAAFLSSPLSNLNSAINTRHSFSVFGDFNFASLQFLRLQSATEQKIYFC